MTDKSKRSTRKQGEVTDGDLVGSTVERGLERGQLQPRPTVIQQRPAVIEESTQPVRSDNTWIVEFFKQQQLLEQQRWDQQQQQQQEHLERMERLRVDEQEKAEQHRAQELDRLEKQRKDELDRLEKTRSEEHENILTQQKELVAEQRDRDRKRRLVEKIPKLEINEHVDMFLCRFEDSMVEAEVDEEEWPRHLKTLLTGAPLAALTRSIPDEKKKNYQILRNALLNACGLSLSDCAFQFFSQTKKSSWTWAEAGRRAEFQVDRIMADCDSRKESTTRMVIARQLTWCSQECASFVRLREPKTVAEATEYMNEFD